MRINITFDSNHLCFSDKFIYCMVVYHDLVSAFYTGVSRMVWQDLARQKLASCPLFQCLHVLDKIFLQLFNWMPLMSLAPKQVNIYSWPNLFYTEDRKQTILLACWWCSFTTITCQDKDTYTKVHLKGIFHVSFTSFWHCIQCKNSFPSFHYKLWWFINV